MTVKRFSVKGMSCAACAARVERAVSSVEGVSVCSVSLLTNSMSVEGGADEEIIAAVKAAGYSASLFEEKKRETPRGFSETRMLASRLVASAALLLVLMYFSMGHSMLSLPVPGVFEKNPLYSGITQLFIALLIMIINRRFYVSGIKGIIHGAPNMDTLISLGSGAAFVYSVWLLFSERNPQGLYFESAAMILTLITVGKLLESVSKGKTTNAIRRLADLSPKTAILIKDGKESIIEASLLSPGDMFALKAGARIPADATVISGSFTADESSLTGESIPAVKTVGNKVSAGTISLSGYGVCRTDKSGADTVLSQIIKLVEDASLSKAPIARLADRVSGVFVPTVMAVALFTAAVWLLCGSSIEFALIRGISVLVISCPCALGLATPVAIMVGSGVGSKHGILYKNAAALEMAGRIKIAAFDKTGTLTRGLPEVTDVIPLNKTSEDELISLASSAEEKSGHPLAGAIVKYARETGARLFECGNITLYQGRGICAMVDGRAVYGGNAEYIGQNSEVSKEVLTHCERLSDEGKTPIIFCDEKKLLGIIAVADAIRPDAAAAMKKLEKMKIRTVLITGDNKRTATAIAKAAGISKVYAEVLPDKKSEIIDALKKTGRVAMTGDGINDAPALTCADIGIAVGAGEDIAIDSADIVLVNSTPSDAVTSLLIGTATLANIRENLFWAFFYNIIGIPIAAGVLIPAFNIQMSPALGAAAMSLSSFCVVCNALRLNFFKLHRKKEEEKVKKTLKIDGMMCAHCEARVKNCLEELDGVLSADVSHKKKTAVVTLCKDVSDQSLINVVVQNGYTVTSIE